MQGKLAAFTTVFHRPYLLLDSSFYYGELRDPLYKLAGFEEYTGGEIACSKKGDGLKKKLSMKVTRERKELDKQEQLIPFGQIRVGSPDPHHHFPCPRFRRRDTHFALYLYR